MMNHVLNITYHTHAYLQTLYIRITSPGFKAEFKRFTQSPTDGGERIAAKEQGVIDVVVLSEPTSEKYSRILPQIRVRIWLQFGLFLSTKH